MLDGEEKIIKMAIRGKASAFGLLYDHYQPRIYRFVAIKVGRREEAEDLTHQVFLNAWQSIGDYRHLGHPFSSWLYKIARNQITDYYRTRRETANLDNIDPEYFVVPASAQFDLSAKMEFERVRNAMRNLKQEYQDVIIMRFIEDIPIKDVAVTLEKSEGAVKLLQHRAIKELRNIIGDEPYEPHRTS